MRTTASSSRYEYLSTWYEADPGIIAQMLDVTESKLQLQCRSSFILFPSKLKLVVYEDDMDAPCVELA